MKTLKNAFFTMIVALAFATVLTSTASAACSVTCAAICRLTCEFAVTGTCSDATIEAKVSRCCAAAFANTPGIENVPCSVTGPEN